MVSQITTGTPFDPKGRPFLRRRPRPAYIAAIALLITAIVAWSVVALKSSDKAATPTDCNQPTPASETSAAPAASAAHPKPPPPPPTLNVVSRDDMLKVTPAPLSTFQVRVLNAASQRGQAQSVSEDLTSQGFRPMADTPFGDDPAYPNHDLRCVAQIRFGSDGKAGAASLWLAVPCAQLVDDGRKGTSVDLALGAYYETKEPSQDQQATLGALRSALPTDPKSGADPELVKAIHSTTC